MRNVLAALVVIVAAGNALGGAGDGRELVRYRQLLNKLDLRCPPGTKLLVSGSGGGLEEACLTSAGVRHGYYLRWFGDGETWAVIGRYNRGRRVGRWIRFNSAGERVSDAHLAR